MNLMVVGKYKNSDVKITDMHISETYCKFLVLSREEENLDRVNREILGEDLNEQVAKLFGEDRNVCRVDFEKFNYKKLLPPLLVYAWLCGEPIKEGWHGSDLILVWLQEKNEDPFEMVKKHFSRLNWGEQARDYLH